MRAIKFRAWDGERMKEVLTLGLHERFISTPKTVAPIEEFKLMQYTGLKDKNGKEIYEGDILKVCNWYGKGGMVGSVYMEEGIWFGATDYLYSAIQTNKAEVIGNIYENPELLS